MIREARAQRLPRRVREVAWRPKKGAPPGARVEVRLALCPSGWLFLDQEPPDGRRGKNPPRLSNRVEVPSR